MKETVRSAPRLQFTDEELIAEGLKKPIEHVQKATKKATKARQKLSGKMIFDKNTAAEQHTATDQPVTASKSEKLMQKTKTQTQRAESLRSELKPDTPDLPQEEVKPISESLLTRSKAAKGKTTPTKTVLKPGDAPQKPTRLSFEPDLKSPHKGKGTQPVTRAVSNEVHRAIRENADGDIGAEAADTSLQASETTLRFGDNMHHRHEFRKFRKAERAEKQVDKANIRFLQKKDELQRSAENANSHTSNPISRAWQKRKIKKEYAAARYSRKTGSSAAYRSGKKAAKETEKDTRRVVSFVSRHKGVVIVLALGALLVFFVQGISSLVPLMESGLSAITAGTYPAEEADVRAAERIYAQKERELQDEMDHYERYHPGYDEYVVDAQEIWHDPYALIAIISAYRGGEEWTIDDAVPIIEKYFAWQYKKTETVTSEQRYRTVIVDGEETQEWFTYTTCTVKLENKILSHAPVYTISRENMGLYALYMSTHGNMDGIFRGKHCSELKDPTIYEVPQELLDADPNFALLIEEANKRLGYPYVWGGYTPDTSFDCSGFVSWLFTSTGVRNIGHAGAKGLYSMSQHISPEEALPGDVIFFAGTIEGDSGITHCGLYVGNGWMVHCGSPCTYARMDDSYHKEHFYAFGRMYEH